MHLPHSVSDSKQECEDYNQTTTAELSEEEEEEVLSKRRPKKKVMEDFVSGSFLLQ